jgi:hypothetical protein
LVRIPIAFFEERANGGAINNLEIGMALHNGRRDLISHPVTKRRSQTLWADKVKEDRFSGVPHSNKACEIVCQVLNSRLEIILRRCRWFDVLSPPKAS